MAVGWSCCFGPAVGLCWPTDLGEGVLLQACIQDGI
jgi:hypothetical protein